MSVLSDNRVRVCLSFLVRYFCSSYLIIGSLYLLPYICPPCPTCVPQYDWDDRDGGTDWTHRDTWNRVLFVQSNCPMCPEQPCLYHVPIEEKWDTWNIMHSGCVPHGLQYLSAVVFDMLSCFPISRYETPCKCNALASFFNLALSSSVISLRTASVV